MATDNFPLTKPVEPLQSVICDAGVAIGANSLLYFDGTYAQPASAQADQGTPAANYALFASKYLGLSNASRSGSESADGNILVLTDIEVEVPCASTTFEVGDKVSAVEAGSGTALEDFKVAKTTDDNLAIGYCTRRGTSLTKVWCRLISRALPHSAEGAADYAITVPITLHASATEQNLFTARESVQVVGIDVVVDVAKGGALTGTICKATGTSAPAFGTTPMHTADAIDFNAAANTVQQITLTSTAADLKLVAGERIGLDLSAALTAGRAAVTIRLRPIK